MRSVLVGLSVVFGALAMVGTGLWCVAGAGIYGSPLSGMRRDELFQVFVLLLAGPLSLLPAGLVGRKRPNLAGAWLVGGGVFSFVWHLGVLMNEGFDQFFRWEPVFEAWAPVLSICAPALLLGSGFLWVGRAEFLTQVRSPAFRRRAPLVLAPVALAAALAAAYAAWTRPVWTVTVTPHGGKAATLRFDPREPFRREDDLDRLFRPLFERAAQMSGRTPLGGYVVTGAPGPGTTEATRTHTLAAERTPNGRLRVLRDGARFTEEMTDAAALADARSSVIREITTSAAREFPYAR